MRRFSGMFMAVVALVACLVIAGCSQAAGSADNAITVSATGTAAVSSDAASFGVSVRGQGEDENAAFASAERTVNDVIAHLKTLGATDAGIRVTVGDYTPVTGDVTVEQVPIQYLDVNGNLVEDGFEEVVYDYSDTVVGTALIATIHVADVPMEQLNAMLRESAAAGAIGFTDISYEVKDREGAYQRALSAAVDAAYDKAKALADASGVYVGRVVNMSENSSADSLDLKAVGDASSLDPRNPETLEVSPAEIPADASVTVSYAIS